MRIFWIITAAVASLLSSCATNDADPCTLHLETNDWTIVPVNSNSKISPVHLENSQWYRDSEGNYLICHNPVRDYMCGGVYETYDLNAQGAYMYDLFVCTR